MAGKQTRMSSLIVEVCSVEEVAVHPNADRLERIRVKNWWCIASKGHYKVGDKAVYLPPDSIVPEALAERWGIAKYCSPLARGIDGQRPPGLRIRANRFRGEPSFGCLQDPDDASWPIGHDVKEHYNVTKWEPPVKCLDGDAAVPITAFHTYTDIENIGNFPGILKEGEEVIVTEKIHGCFKSTSLVTMSDGTKKKIKDVQIGDFVMGVDVYGKVISSRVTQTFNHGRNGKKWVNIQGERRKAGRGNHYFSIKCTNDHKIWKVGAEYTKASDLQINDEVLLLRTELSIQPIYEQILIGKMLGDGSIHKSGDSMAVDWGHANKEYTIWMDNILGEVSRGISGSITSGYGSEIHRGGTVFRWHIAELFKNFFNSENVKIVPPCLPEIITPLAIAYWYMDDGSLSHEKNQEDRALFAVCGFDKDSVCVLQKCLKNMGINSEQYLSEKEHLRIRLNSNDSERMFLLISPYIPECMQYKLPERYRGCKPWLPAIGKSYKTWLVPQKINNINNLEECPNEHDLCTETSNFFVSDVLVHNSNSRVGVVLCADEQFEGYATWQLMGGSHGTRRKEFNDKGIRSKYWFPFSINGEERPMQKMLDEIRLKENAVFSVIVFGEIFGPGIQDMHYGQKGLAYRIFDIAVDGKYLNWDKTVEYVDAYNEFDIRVVPVLYRGPFSMQVMNQFVDGPTTVVDSPDKVEQSFKGREGIVIKPVVERFDRDLGSGSGRVILKYISVDYHDRKNPDRTEDH